MPKKPKAAPPPTDEDIEATLAVSSSPEELAAVETVVAQAITLELRINRGEQLLKDLKAELQNINHKTLPDTLARANTSLYQVSTGELKGWKVEIVNVVAGSLPKVTKNDDTPEKIADKVAKRERGLQFIRDAESGDIIKTVMEVTIEKGQDNLIGDLKAKADELGLAYEVSSDVHHATLSSWAKEWLKSPEEGKEFPVEDLGLFIGRAAKLTAPKEK